jgi:hypothetical protein
VTLTLRRFQPGDAPAWDGFVEGCLQATFLHSRRFLSYHGDRFEDVSLIVEDDGECVGVFPAAVAPSDRSLVVSHPGATYGGVVHRGALRGERMVEALRAICALYAEAGFARLSYKVVPAIYHRAPAQDDLYALFRLGFRRARCDLSSAIDLANRLRVSNRRTRALKKAVKGGVRVERGIAHITPFWGVLSDNLRTRFDARPVHTIEEIRMLSERFPNDIHLVCGLVEERVVAGVVLFETPTATHAQYIASAQEGQTISALDAVFENCIAAAAESGRRWFDFGISNEDCGQVLNEGLYEFKSNFGGGGVVHEFYECRLGRENETT